MRISDYISWIINGAVNYRGAAETLGGKINHRDRPVLNSLLKCPQPWKGFVVTLCRFIQQLSRFIQQLSRFIQQLIRFIRQLSRFIQLLSRIQQTSSFIQPVLFHSTALPFRVSFITNCSLHISKVSFCSKCGLL